MPQVAFDDIQVGTVYVTQGGVAIIDDIGNFAGWGYDRVLVTMKNTVKIIVATPWGTTCILDKDYPLYSTRETSPSIEFKLLTTYTSKETIPFDEALSRKICKELIVHATLTPTELIPALIDYFREPRTISEAAQEFDKRYQQIKYTIDKIDVMSKYNVIHKENAANKTVQIIEVK